MHRMLVIAIAAAIALAPAALAQTKPSPSTSAQPGSSGAETKFKTADKNNSGMLEGAEADAYKAKMAQVDTNKDGKISRDEFAAGTKAGHIN